MDSMYQPLYGSLFTLHANSHKIPNSFMSFISMNMILNQGIRR